MKYLAVIVLSIVTLSLSAQEKAKVEGVIKSIQTPSEGDGKVEIYHHDALLDSLMNVHVLFNEIRGVSGYRILVFAEGGQLGRDRMYEVRADFAADFPDLKYYEKHENLQYKIKVGDYRTREEAYKTFKDIKKKYRTAIMVPDIINYPVLD